MDPSHDHQSVIDEAHASFNFKDKWLSIPEFSHWLHRCSRHDFCAYCSYCDKHLESRKGTLNNHVKSQSHAEEAKVRVDGVKTGLSMTEKVLRAELKYAAFFISRQIFYLTAEYLMPLNHQLFDGESSTMTGIRLGRIKLGHYIKYILCPGQARRLRPILSKNPYVVTIDEAKDKTVEEFIGIEVRYEDVEAGQIRQSLWEVSALYTDENTKADAEHLFNALITAFTAADIPIANMCAFISDTCNVMFGQHNSVASRFRTRYPHVLCIKCGCHISHLCVRDSTKQDPLNCEQFVRDIYNYVNPSGKRTKAWQQCQIALGLNPLAVKKQGDTRWLSLRECLKMILRRWPALLYFLSRETAADAEKLFATMQDPLLFGYLLFLDCLIDKFVIVNVILQSSEPIIDSDRPKMTRLLIDLLKTYMIDSYVDGVADKDLSSIDPNLTTKFKPLHVLFFNANVSDFIAEHREKQDMTKEGIDDFLRSCRSMVIEGCSQLLQRFEYGQSHLPFLKYFHPQNAMSENFHEKNPSLKGVYEAFPFLQSFYSEDIRNAADQEWALMAKFQIAEELWKEKRQDEFWTSVKNSYFKSKPLFRNLAKIAMTVLLIPTSNASIERIWSRQDGFKTKKQARTSAETMRSRLLADSYIADKGGPLAYEPDAYELKLAKKVNSMFERDEMLRRKKETKSSYKGEDIPMDLTKKCREMEEKFRVKKKPKKRKNPRTYAADDDGSEPASKRSSFGSNDSGIGEVESDPDEEPDDLSPSEADKSENNSTDQSSHPDSIVVSDTEIEFQPIPLHRLCVIVAVFRSEYWKRFRNYSELQIGAPAMRSLRDCNYINSQIIDAFMILNKLSSVHWNDIDFFPLDFTDKILGDNRDLIISDTSTIYKLEFEFKKLVFLPYLHLRHFKLIVLNIVEETACYYDPFGADDSEEDFKYLFNYLTRYSLINQNSVNNLPNIQWKIVPAASNRPLQKDGCNCGCYIMHYMEAIAAGKWTTSFNPKDYRLKIESRLRQNSDDLSTECVGCTKRRHLKFQCRHCQRWVHDVCYEVFFNDQTSCRLCAAGSNEFASDSWAVQDMGFPNPYGKNRCWLNSSLQVLLRLPIFETLDMLNFLPNCSVILKSLVDVRKKMRVKNLKVSQIENALTDLKRTLGELDRDFTTNNQQDVQSFIILLLDFISQDFKNYNQGSLISDHIYSRLQTEIEDVYEIRYQEKYTCNMCNGVKINDMMGFDILLHLDDEVKNYTIEELVSNYFQSEQRNIECTNSSCPMYGAKTSQIQSFEIRTPPKFLILSVKRQFFNHSTKRTEKRHDVVHIEERLQCPYFKDAQYNLKMVICHEGLSTESGHYYSFVNKGDGLQWTKYNDSRVTSKTSLEVLNDIKRKGYVIFYENV